MTQETPQTPTPPSAAVPLGARTAPLSRRVMWGVIGLVVVTVAALWVAWRWPDQTLMHFWLVTQVVPVVYLLLAGWGVDASADEADVV